MNQPRFPKTGLALAITALAAGAGHVTPAQASGPVLAEFQVNSPSSTPQVQPKVAMDADGDFVVVWVSYFQDDPASSSGRGVYAQRYNAAGAAQGGEFRVNTYTTGIQANAAVAMDADGDFVVAWSGEGVGDSEGIFAQRFNATGTPQGGEFLVNAVTTGSQLNPVVATEANGDFAVGWISNAQGGGLQFDVFAKRYTAAGAAIGGEFQVNTFTTGLQAGLAIAMDADGDFVMGWQSGGTQDGDNYGIYAQRYNNAGAAVGGEFRVNTYTTGAQIGPVAAMDRDGDFIVGWQSRGQDGDDFGIYAQRYNAAGTPQGAEFQVSTYTTSTQGGTAVGMDADGDFVVSWGSFGQDGDGYGVYAQRYNAAGVARGGEQHVSTYTTSQQVGPAIALDADGDFVVAWRSEAQDLLGSTGIYAQRYQADTLTPSLTVTTSGAATNTTPVAGGPGGTYSFNAQFCNNTALTMTGLSSKTLTLTNGNNLLNRTRDAFAAPGAAAIPAGGVGTEKDLTAANGYTDLSLTNGECVTVPYQIGLTNRNQFNFTIRIRGDNGL